MSALQFLYHTVPGRLLLKPLTSRTLSRLAGRFLDSPLSKGLIRPFVKNAGIRLEDYESDGFRCFNDCFTRKIKDGLRPVDPDPEHLIAPCDGLLSVWPIQNGLVVPIKQSLYSIERLLQDKKLAKEYEGGLCLVYRLCVDHYHRYSYVETGEKSGNRFLPGVLHTVRPVALEAVPVFTENCREYTVIRTEKFGPLVQMEVGAMLVGRIFNHEQESGPVERGVEKGMFLYGGSTIVVLVPPSKVEMDQKYLHASAAGQEVAVKLGEPVGHRIISF